MSSVDDLVHRFLQPVECRAECGIVREAPVERVVEEVEERIQARVRRDGLGDQACEGRVARHGVEASLGLSGLLWTGDLIR